MSDIIVHEGKMYRKVDRSVREGDHFIVPKESNLDYTAGKVYKVTMIDEEGDPHFIDDIGDRWHLLEGRYYVLEPASPSVSVLESELAAMKEKIQQLEQQLAEAKNPDRMKVGDYAKVVSMDYGWMHGFKVGDIVQITENPYGDYDCDYRIQSLDGRNVGYAHKERGLIVRAGDEEVAEAIQTLERQKKITLEITKEEFGTIVAALGKTNNAKIQDYAKDRSVLVVNDSLQFYERLRDLYHAS